MSNGRAVQDGRDRTEAIAPSSPSPGHVRTPRAPARACLPLLPSGPGGFTG
ncbi:conserved domain protein [Actinomyces sp. oral taxon 170 str. F0386]|nr:conserved domain protein [Actinomyces sp. oral taxon 170 str. F0386]